MSAHAISCMKVAHVQTASHVPLVSLQLNTWLPGYSPRDAQLVFIQKLPAHRIALYSIFYPNSNFVSWNAQHEMVSHAILGPCCFMATCTVRQVERGLVGLVTNVCSTIAQMPMQC